MGMFSKLFGGSGSDKADRMRQMAIDAFTAIQTPALKDLQIQLDKYVSAGKLSPEEAEAELLQSNAFNDIVTDPALAGAQKQALVALQEIGTQGGMTAIDKARLQDITNEQNQVAKSRREAVLQQARQRGMGGSDITTVNELMEEQAAADRAAQRGTDVAAEAQARALQALVAAGDTAGKIRGQDYGEQANKAQAENAIDLFNKQTLNQTNLYNVDAFNRAQAANLANEQSILNANTGTSNANKQYNANAVQQDFQNKMNKAQGVAGTYNAWAGDATAAKRSEQAADQALLGGMIQTGATALGTAFGGPVGGMAAAGATSPNAQFGTVYSPTRKEMGYAEGGEVTMPEDEFKKEHDRLLNTLENPSPASLESEAERQRKEMGEYGMNCGGRVPSKNFEEGGKVPGQAIVPGNSPVNDTVSAKLSPGEVVVPRTAMSDDEEFDAFMEKFRPSKREKQIDPDKPLMVQALRNLSSRIDRMEGR